MRSSIQALGSFLPGKMVCNDELIQFPSGARSLIRIKTGIEGRYYADDNETVSVMGAKAARICLTNSDVDKERIDGIIVATSSPDRILPPSATAIQAMVGVENSFAFDINAVCSGGIYGIAVADAFVRSGMYRNILVVAAEKYSSFLNPIDFSTRPYFGDGAAALILSCAPDDSPGVLTTAIFADGNGSELIEIPAGGSSLPGWKVDNHSNFYFKMDGRKVYEFVTKKVPLVIECLLHNSSISIKDVKKIIPHQANVNLIKDLAKRMGLQEDKFYINAQYVGNTAAASVLIALDEAVSTGVVGKGDIVLLVAFGGGLTWGGALVRI